MLEQLEPTSASSWVLVASSHTRSPLLFLPFLLYCVSSVAQTTPSESEWECECANAVWPRHGQSQLQRCIVVQFCLLIACLFLFHSPSYSTFGWQCSPDVEHFEHIWTHVSLSSSSSILIKCECPLCIACALPPACVAFLIPSNCQLTSPHLSARICHLPLISLRVYPHRPRYIGHLSALCHRTGDFQQVVR